MKTFENQVHVHTLINNLFCRDISFLITMSENQRNRGKGECIHLFSLKVYEFEKVKISNIKDSKRICTLFSIAPVSFELSCDRDYILNPTMFYLYIS